MQDEIDEAEDQFAAEICWFCILNLFELFGKLQSTSILGALLLAGRA